jgi:hypothetical protein
MEHENTVQDRKGSTELRYLHHFTWPLSDAPQL